MSAVRAGRAPAAAIELVEVSSPRVHRSARAEAVEQELLGRAGVVQVIR